MPLPLPRDALLPLTKSKLLLSAAKLGAAPAAGLLEPPSLLAAWLRGGDESKTGLKSSSAEREMLAKSSSAVDPSFASSSPSKSSSRSSNACLAGSGGGAAADEAGSLCPAAGAVEAEAARESPQIEFTLDWPAGMAVLMEDDEVAAVSDAAASLHSLQSAAITNNDAQGHRRGGVRWVVGVEDVT